MDIPIRLQHYIAKETECWINFHESMARIPREVEDLELNSRHGRTEINTPRGVFPFDPMPTSYISTFDQFISNFVK